MKVGILTFHRVPNVGAYLQCASLVSAVRKLGHEVEVIDYYPLNQQGLFRLNCRSELRRSLRYPRSIPGVFRSISNRREHLIAARRDIKSLPIGPLVTESNALAQLEYDRVILGSDEIWNLNSPIQNKDLAYSGICFPSEGLCSYGPSFGSLSDHAMVPQEMRESIARINHLSARDRNSVEILSSLGLEATMVVDPTLLEGRAPVGNSTPMEGNEIVIYGAPVGDACLKELQQLAARRGCDLRAVIYPQGPTVSYTPGMNACDFLEVFRNAKAIVTTTFHGCIFASLAGKPFAVINPGQKINKVKGLLETLGAEDRLTLDMARLGELLAAPLHAEALNARLEVASSQSMEFLNNALV